MNAIFEGGDEYLVTSFTGGTTNLGQTVSLLPPAPSPDSYLGNDNLLFYGASEPFDSSGISHTVTGGGLPTQSANWECSSTECLLTGTGLEGSRPISFTITATTPLPAALPLFAGGLGVIDLLTRRRKQKIAAEIAAT